jgi:serine protease
MSEMLRFRALGPALLLFAALASAGTESWAVPGEKRFMPGQVLVFLEEGRSPIDSDALADRHGCRVVYRGRYRDFVVLEGSSGRDVEALSVSVSREPGVLFAEPNFIRRAIWEPDDPYYQDGFQWNFEETRIDMPRAWEMEQGGDAGARIGILDTGVAYEDHPIPSYESYEVQSLDGFYHVAPDLSGTAFADGYDFIHGDDHPNDQNGHGTHVCGTVAQTTDNGQGCAGIAFGATIVPIQVLNYYGLGTSAQLIDGVDHAREVGCNVLNMSFGAPDSSHGEHLALRDAHQAGVVLVAASGNVGLNRLWYPAGYEEVIAVGATDASNQRSSYSNFGEDLDLVAPGGTSSQGIVQESFHDPNDQQDPDYHTVVDSFGFIWAYGTSMAAPHVSGVAGLIASMGYTEPDQILSVLTETAMDIDPPGFDSYTGHGLLDAGSAVAAVFYDSIPPVFDVWVEQDSSQLTEATVRILADEPLFDNEPPESVTVRIGGTDSPVSMVQETDGTYSGTFDLREDTLAVVRVRGRDLNGNVGEDSTLLSSTRVEPGESAEVLSPNRYIRIEIPQGVLSDQEFYCTINEVGLGSGGFPGADSTPSSSAYLVGPSGREVNGRIGVVWIPVSSGLNATDGHAIFAYRDGSWSMLPSLEALSLYAQTDGFYPVAWAYVDSIPDEPYLYVVPNPFRGSAFIEYGVETSGEVEVSVYDAAGRHVRTLVRRDHEIGVFYANWSPEDVPSGVYVVHVIGPGELRSSRTFLYLR